MPAIDRTFFASAKATVPESCTNARTAMASSPSDATPTHGWSNSDSTTSEAGDATPGSLIGRSQNHLSIVFAFLIECAPRGRGRHGGLGNPKTAPALCTNTSRQARPHLSMISACFSAKREDIMPDSALSNRRDASPTCSQPARQARNATTQRHRVSAFAQRVHLVRRKRSMLAKLRTKSAIRQEPDGPWTTRGCSMAGWSRSAEHPKALPSPAASRLRRLR